MPCFQPNHKCASSVRMIGRVGSLRPIERATIQRWGLTVDAEQLRVVAAKRRGELVREAEQVTTPLAARDHQRSIAGHVEV